MEIMYTEIWHGLPGVGQTKTVEHFIYLKTYFLKQITFFPKMGPKDMLLFCWELQVGALMNFIRFLLSYFPSFIWSLLFLGCGLVFQATMAIIPLRWTCVSLVPTHRNIGAPLWLLQFLPGVRQQPPSCIGCTPLWTTKEQPSPEYVQAVGSSWTTAPPLMIAPLLCRNTKVQSRFCLWRQRQKRHLTFPLLVLHFPSAHLFFHWSSFCRLRDL